MLTAKLRATPSTPGTGYSALYPKSDGKWYFKTAAGVEVPMSVALGTPQATTSGTAFTFSNLPAGTSELIVLLDEVSLSGGDNLRITIGPSGGLETTGYSSSSIITVASASNSAAVVGTAGFDIFLNSSGIAMRGAAVLRLVNPSTNVWTIEGGFGYNGSASITRISGRKALASVLSQVSLTRTGTDTFDSGQVNIQYR
jgi:hypothetical protein